MAGLQVPPEHVRPVTHLRSGYVRRAADGLAQRQVALINGAVGVITAADGRPITLVGFTITGAKIVAIDLIDDRRRITEADLAILGR